jgi:hypothetical protein
VDPLEYAWKEQSVWSQTAGRLKRDLERNRAWALRLGVAGAILSGAAVAWGIDRSLGKVLAALSALAVGVAGLIRQSGQGRVQSWTNARAVSEALKSEVYLHLARVTDDARFEEQVEAIDNDASGLIEHRAGIEPAERSLPEVDGIDSYVEKRVGEQIDYYEHSANGLRTRVTWVRRAEGALAVAAVVLAALGGIAAEDALAVWVPVVTTVAAAVTAHAAAARYEYLLVEYLRTAHALRRLRDRQGTARGLSDEELIRRAEGILSAQNAGWLVKLTSGDDAG